MFLLSRSEKGPRAAVIDRIEAAPNIAHHRSIVESELLAYKMSQLPKNPDIEGSVPDIRRHYMGAASGPALVDNYFSRWDIPGRISRVASELLGDPLAYPLELIRAADMVASAKAARRLPPLIKIAVRDHWFSG
jgi:hypothetical protein